MSAIDAWDLVRLANLTLALAALVVMATRVRHWLALDVPDRFHWLSTAGLVASIAYAGVELLIGDQPGGPRLVLLLAALAYLHVALWVGRPSRRPARLTGHATRPPGPDPGA